MFGIPRTKIVGFVIAIAGLAHLIVNNQMTDLRPVSDYLTEIIMGPSGLVIANGLALVFGRDAIQKAISTVSTGVSK